MSAHQHFEELAAFAAMGELSAEELAELKSHLRGCEPCSKAYAQFSHVVQEELPVLHKEVASWRGRLGRLLARNGYKERFLKRATAHGFRFSPEVEAHGFLPRAPLTAFPARFALPALLLLLVALVVVSLELQRARSWSSAGAEEVRQQVDELLRERDRLNEEIKAHAQVIADLRAELAKTQSALEAEAGRSSNAEHDRGLVASEAERLKSALDTELSRSSDLGNRLQDRERRLADLGQQLERLSNLRAAEAAVVASQQRQLEEMTQELRAQKEMLDREHELLAAGRDIRELMGARNLHIIDVFDTDLKGKNRRAFGRVFHTEGKSLIFYAFDLNGSKVQNAKHSFQAWGMRDGQNGSARSLGIFYLDDAGQRRWVLKFEDPRILSQIDSVFVTVEPFGGAEKPSGQKLLYAYLKNPANHP